MPDEPLRPRFGKVVRRDGSEDILVFHPTDTPNEFIALSALDESELTINEGDTMKVDVLGPDQSVIFRKGDGNFSKPNKGALAGPTKEEVPMADETPKKKISGWDALGNTLFVIALFTMPATIAVIYVAAVRFIF